VTRAKIDLDQAGALERAKSGLCVSRGEFFRGSTGQPDLVRGSDYQQARPSIGARAVP